jgi:CBS domain-containing protein
MKTIGDVMTHGVSKLQTIDPQSTVKQAVDLLNQHNIGALPVCDAGGRLVGIITERDVLRLCGRNGIAGLDTHMVSEVMTPSPMVGVPDDSVASVMRIMTDHRIRHLPVMDGGRLVGIASIGDVVKVQLEETNAEVNYLREYVSG